MTIKKTSFILTLVMSLVLCLTVVAGCNTVDEKKDQIVSDPNAQPKGETHDLQAGQGVKFDNGLTVTVSSITPNASVNYTNNPVTKCIVTVTNNGTSNIKMGQTEWTAVDSNGVIVSETLGYKGWTKETTLMYGGTLDLAAGGTKTGELCFDGNITKVTYKPSLSTSEANWTP